MSTTMNTIQSIQAELGLSYTANLTVGQMADMRALLDAKIAEARLPAAAERNSTTMPAKTTTKPMENALAADTERVASMLSRDGLIELLVSILNGDDFALSLPRDAPVSELRARVAQAMGAKNPERVRLFHADGEAELTEGDCARRWVASPLHATTPLHATSRLLPWRQ